MDARELVPNNEGWINPQEEPMPSPSEFERSIQETVRECVQRKVDEAVQIGVEQARAGELTDGPEIYCPADIFGEEEDDDLDDFAEHSYNVNEAQIRKGRPLATGVLDYFPDALLAVAETSKAGNDQHNPGQPLHWDKTKSTDHADCLMRHLIDRGTFDTDGIRHSAKVAWRALALLQTEIEAEQAAPSAPTSAPQQIEYRLHVNLPVSDARGQVYDFELTELTQLQIRDLQHGLALMNDLAHNQYVGLQVELWDNAMGGWMVKARVRVDRPAASQPIDPFDNSPIDPLPTPHPARDDFSQPDPFGEGMH